MADGGREGSVLAKKLGEEHWLAGLGRTCSVRNGTWEGRGKKTNSSTKLSIALLVLQMKACYLFFI